MDEAAPLMERCPRCGRVGALILYGLPAFGDPGLEKDLKSGRVVLGGCVVSDATRECAGCRVRWRAESDGPGFGPQGPSEVEKIEDEEYEREDASA